MSKQWKPNKKTVELGSAPRPSRIRRNPVTAPAPKAKLVVIDPEERDRWAVTIGVVSFALALFVIILAFGGYSGWSPSQYRVHVNASE